MGQFLCRLRPVCVSIICPLICLDLEADTPHSYFMIYETKGLSLEQVDELYGVVSQAWKSKQFRPQVQFSEIDPTNARSSSLAEISANQERKRSVHEESPVATEKV